MKEYTLENDVTQSDLRSRAKQTWLSHVWIFSRKRPLGAFGGLLLIILVVMSVLAPLVTPYDPLVPDEEHRLEAPSGRYLAGTDIFGRDLYSRIVYGARVSLYVGLVSVSIATLIGTLLGITSAYVGRTFDMVVQRFVDAIQGIPSLILIMAIVIALGASLFNVTIAISFGFVARMTRLSRSQALSVKEQDFVLAAQAIGASRIRIILRHVGLNSLTPSIVVGTALLGTAIVAEASLSFLGLGVPPPHPSWGRMLQAGARGYMEAAPWLVTFPGIALTLTVFGFNLFGDAMRDSLDPRLRGR
ncbi:ABC transporter permease [Dehalococcoidia bacterium]|nr:ABC transporter permease [Dehalococcoidia bacterium]